MNIRHQIRILGRDNLAPMRAMLAMFGKAFSDVPTYTGIGLGMPTWKSCWRGIGLLNTALPIDSDSDSDRHLRSLLLALPVQPVPHQRNDAIDAVALGLHRNDVFRGRQMTPSCRSIAPQYRACDSARQLGGIGFSNAIGRPKKGPEKAPGRARRGPKYASLGGFSAQSGRLQARGWRVGRSLNVHGSQDWSPVSGSAQMLAMACRHSAQRQQWPACQG
jgi:hypothetical protein